MVYAGGTPVAVLLYPDCECDYDATHLSDAASGSGVHIHRIYGRKGTSLPHRPDQVTHARVQLRIKWGIAFNLAMCGAADSEYVGSTVH